MPEDITPRSESKPELVDRPTLQECESVIVNFKEARERAVLAITQIHHWKLWEPEYKSFERYIAKRWQWSRKTAYLMVTEGRSLLALPPLRPVVMSSSEEKPQVETSHGVTNEEGHAEDDVNPEPAPSDHRVPGIMGLTERQWAERESAAKRLAEQWETDARGWQARAEQAEHLVAELRAQLNGRAEVPRTFDPEIGF